MPDARPKPSDIALASGGGEAGELLRSIDWSKTPLGPIATWSSALKTTLATILHSRHPMFLWWGPELIQFYNDAYRPSFGTGKHPNAMGARGRESWPESWALIGPQIEAVMTRGEATWQEDQLVPIERNGRLEDVYWTCGYSPVFDDDGSIGGTLVVCNETTQRVLQEQATRKVRETMSRERSNLLMARRAMEAAIAELRLMVESIPTLAWTTTPDGWIDFYNQGWYGYTGTNFESMQGWGWESVHHPDDVELVKKRWRASLESGEPFEMEFRLRGADGVFRWFLTRALPIRDSSGKIVRWFGTNTNVDELKQVRSDLESANRAKDEFLAMLGHELRNPLSPILTALEMMRLRAPDSGQREREVIERQVKHMVRLVDDLLDVSRITRGKVELRKEPVDIADVIARAIETVSPLLERKSHHLSTDVKRGLVVDADAVRLAQAVGNLLTNSAKYTQDRGEIAVSAHAKDGRIVVSVRDSGNGIAPEILPNIFDLFVQERQEIDRSHGGLGLGLAIVKRLVSLHEGTVSAASAGKGRGSTFEISLPASRSDAVGAGAAASLPAPAAGPRFRILIVDDNKDAADLLSDWLTSLGHATRVAYDGIEGLKTAAAFSPQVALLDIGLPVMDGYELARRMRAMDALRATTLIAVTGYGQASDVALATSAGFDRHLVKPVEIHGLESTLRALGDAPRG